MWTVLKILFGLLVLVVKSSGSKILYLLPSGPQSHVRFSNAIIDALVENGHHVTFLTISKSPKERQNVTEIYIDTNVALKIFPDPFKISSVDIATNSLYFAPDSCVESRGHPAAIEALAGDYDVAFVSGFFCECYYAALHDKKIPYIMFSPNTPTGFQWKLVGMPPFPTVSPPRSFGVVHPMTLWQRIASTLMIVVEDFFVERLYVPRMQAAMENAGFAAKDGTYLWDAAANASLLVINSVKTMEFPIRPTVSQLLYVGGIHIKESTDLSLEFSSWIDESGTDGFVMFSLGSMANTVHTEEEKLAVLFNVFKKLKQRVIMKWDSDISLPVPANIMITKWLPQQQLLAHPKLRLFITHGGLHSTLEAVYYGVPIVGIPIFADQENNVVQSVHQGYAQYVPWSLLNEEDLDRHVSTVINDPVYKNNVVGLSKIMRDQQHSPKEELVYWTEYVIRHNGAHHLKSVFVDMPWYKIYNVDVWAVLAGIVFFQILCSFFLLRIAYRKISGKREKRKRD